MAWHGVSGPSSWQGLTLEPEAATSRLPRPSVPGWVHFREGPGAAPAKPRGPSTLGSGVQASPGPGSRGYARSCALSTSLSVPASFHHQELEEVWTSGARPAWGRDPGLRRKERPAGLVASRRRHSTSDPPPGHGSGGRWSTRATGSPGLSRCRERWHSALGPSLLFRQAGATPSLPLRREPGHPATCGREQGAGAAGSRPAPGAGCLSQS